MQAYDGFDVQTAVGTTISLSCTADLSALPFGFLVDAEVHAYDGVDIYQFALGTTMFAKGDAVPAQTEGQWLYDGDRTVSYTAFLESGVHYRLITRDAINGAQIISPVVGADAIDTLTLVMPAAPTDGVDFFTFWALAFIQDGDAPSLSSKVFFPADDGFPHANRGWPGSRQPPGTDVVFDYDGGNPGTVSVTWFAQDGVWYILQTNDYSFGGAGGIGTGATRSLSSIGTVIGNTGESFSMTLQESNSFPGAGRGNYIATKSFTIGTPGVHDDTATFSYDGDNSVDVTFPTVSGRRYVVQGLSPGNDSPLFYDSGALLAAGSSITHTVTTTDANIIGDGFWVYVYWWKNYASADDEYPIVANRLFQTGVPGIGLFDLTYNSPASAGATTQSATNVERTEMQLNGLVNPGGVSSVAYFQYGRTLALGSETPHVSVGSGSAPVAFDQTITGLMPNHRYYYRAVLDQT